MFAHYVAEETPRYAFRFIGEGENFEIELHASYVDSEESENKRMFFLYAYGGAIHVSHFQLRKGDLKGAFERRVARYFRRYFSVLEKRYEERLRGIQRIRLELVRVNSESRVIEVRTIGHYDTKSETFQHTWSP